MIARGTVLGKVPIPMPITRSDQKIIFGYLKKARGGINFGKILEPDPKPVAQGGIVSLRSVREVKAAEDQLFEFWEELKRTGIIRPVDRLNPEWFVLTEKGKEVAAADDFDLTTPSLEIDKIIVDNDLRGLVIRSFADQKYEDAVFKAFKHLEERVRAKAGQSSAAIGASLMTNALHHQNGVLRVPVCHTPAEEEGVFMLFKGAIQLFKNPSSHRTVDWNDARRAAEAILFADFLLGLLDQSVPR